MLGSRWFQMDRLPPAALDNIAFCLGGNDDTTGWFNQLFVWAITFWQLWASWYREFYSTWYWDRSSNLNVPLWRLAPSRLMAPGTSLFVPYYLIPRCLSRMFQEPRRYIWRCMSMFMHVSLKTHCACTHKLQHVDVHSHNIPSNMFMQTFVHICVIACILRSCANMR